MTLSSDHGWLRKDKLKADPYTTFSLRNTNKLTSTLKKEISYFFEATMTNDKDASLILEVKDNLKGHPEGYQITTNNNTTKINSKTEDGLLYGVYHLIRLYQKTENPDLADIHSEPTNNIRMINHWDNFDGTVERGYAGRSIFFEDNSFLKNDLRIEQYAQLLASVGINAITINNVNVHEKETFFLVRPLLNEVEHLAKILRKYAIKLYLSVNYASPIEIGGLDTADPLDENVQRFWQDITHSVYEAIPDFGGYVVKADSENRPGPFTYERTHADGANMLGEALEPYGGNVFWRCFVYNNHQDWRDRDTDRARAAYDHFSPLDGEFNDNVILQIKNGPMDFQVREATSPLFGGLRSTNQALELQITQEYTGQQKHIFYWVPQWKEILNFDTYMDGEGSTIQKVLKKYPHNTTNSGIVAVANIGRDDNWTGHKLAQSNLYGYGRLIWNPNLTSEEILDEWMTGTFNLSEESSEILKEIMLSSWDTYEKYTSPLGIGWMVEPNHHYGPNIDGYEYSMWGTYHFSDRNGLGVDRTLATGTGFTRQYHDENFKVYENVETCPEELLLFFHHLPYDYKLDSGKTIIQHIYDTHFEGYNKVEEYQEQWEKLKPELDEESYNNVSERLVEQLRSAREWKDQVNTYYYRKSGIEDKKGRTIYP